MRIFKLFLLILLVAGNLQAANNKKVNSEVSSKKLVVVWDKIGVDAPTNFGQGVFRFWIDRELFGRNRLELEEKLSLFLEYNPYLEVVSMSFGTDEAHGMTNYLTFIVRKKSSSR